MRCIFRVIVVSALLVLCACESPEQTSAKGAPLPPGKAVAKSAAIPDSIVLVTKQGEVTLPHLAHAKRLNCATCHSEIEPGKIAWDKDTVHSYCRDCHITNGGGPTTCAACHKK